MKSRLVKIAGMLMIVAGIAGITAFADDYFEISKNIDVFAALFKDVNTYYVDDVEPSKLMRTCIDAMLKTLDPFTNYFSESQIETARIQQGGKFGGLGIDIEIMNSYPVIVSVTQDQPADKAGLKVGDIIKSVDGQSTQNRTKDDVNKALVGEPKTAVALQIERNVAPLDTKELSFSIQREDIQETNVPFSGMVGKDIGCVKLKIFNENAGRDVRNAIDSLKRTDPDLKGIILDLRSNPGGLLNEGVNVVNIFIDKGELVVNTRGRVQEWNNSFHTLDEPLDDKIPLVIIANSMSASASEIVSGTMQDYDRGVIIGQKTYGKGLVQTTQKLSYNTMLKVTTAKYYIPSGRCIQAINYAERNPDGSVKHIPDSLKVAFKTKNGRLVWDGGGIDPDVQLPKPEISQIARALEDKNYIFNFASQYKLLHDSIPDPAKFKLTDKDYADFVAYVNSKGITYKTTTEAELEELKDAATDEKYFDALKTQYDDIQKKLANDKDHDLEIHKNEIKSMLEDEIVGRYYYAYGKVKKSYENDSEVSKAVEILNNPKEYNELLSAKK